MRNKNKCLFSYLHIFITYIYISIYLHFYNIYIYIFIYFHYFYLIAFDVLCDLSLRKWKCLSPKCRCSVPFSNEVLDFINFPKILKSDELFNDLSLGLDECQPTIVVYILHCPVKSQEFKFKLFCTIVESLWMCKLIEFDQTLLQQNMVTHFSKSIRRTWTSKC